MNKTLQRLKLWIWYKTKVRKPLTVKKISKSNSDCLVFLHGIASNSLVWNQVISHLRSDYDIVLVDLLGFGTSPKPNNIEYNINQHTYAVYYSLKKAGVKKPFTIVGHSMGSIIATHFAANFTKNVKRLVLCSMPIYKKAELSDKKLYWWQKETDNLYFRLYQMLRHKKDFSLRTAQMLRRMGLRQVELNDESWIAFRNSLKNVIENQSVESDLKKVKIPVDIIYGKLDFLLITKHIRHLSKLHNTRIVACSARHDITRRYGTDIAKLIKTF